MLILKLILILIAAFFLCAAIQGIIRANRMTPEEQAAFLQDYKAQKAKRKAAKKAKKEARKIYKKHYDYWYEKSYDVIDGYAIQSAARRREYAEKKTQEELNGTL